MALLTHVLALSATAASLAYLWPLVLSHLADLPPLTTPLRPAPSPSTPCPAHTYTTTVLSLDPLLLLLHGFVSPSEAAAITALGAPLLVASPVTGSGAGTDAADARVRTSASAPLPPADATVACVLARARALLRPGLRVSDMGAPQLVRYSGAGQRFDVHADWFARPRLAPEDVAAAAAAPGGAARRRRLYNRAATLFVVLRSNVSEGSGETWFPYVEVGGGVGGQAEEVGDGERPPWRAHEDGGVAVRPVEGNALFWVNLLPNGTGDARVVHAGLPIGEGVKTGLNIWPRVFFGPDA